MLACNLPANRTSTLLIKSNCVEGIACVRPRSAVIYVRMRLYRCVHIVRVLVHFACEMLLRVYVYVCMYDYHVAVAF